MYFLLFIGSECYLYFEHYVGSVGTIFSLYIFVIYEKALVCHVNNKALMTGHKLNVKFGIREV